jgi:hypothetical protein
MRSAAAIVFAVLTLEAHAAESEKTLMLPHALQTGQIAVIQVQVGKIARGQEIHITTAAGRELGVISPFGVRSGHAAGTYPIPVPADAVAGQQLTVHVSVTGNGTQPHAPTAQEVRSIEVVIGGTAKPQPDHEEKK